LVMGAWLLAMPLLAPTAHAEDRTFRGLVSISGNRADNISLEGGAHGKGNVSFLGISLGGGGGKGVTDPILNVQGVSVKDVGFNATVRIADNTAREITVDGAHLNVQGVMVRR